MATVADGALLVGVGEGAMAGAVDGVSLRITNI